MCTVKLTLYSPALKHHRFVRRCKGAPELTGDVLKQMDEGWIVKGMGQEGDWLKVVREDINDPVAMAADEWWLFMGNKVRLIPDVDAVERHFKIYNREVY